MTDQNETYEIVDEGSLHHYRTEIPNILIDLGLDPRSFCLVVDHFRVGKEISSSEWKFFIEKGIAESFSYSQQDILDILKSKKAQKIAGVTKICEWCQGSTYVLHSHHFPIRRCDGGTNAVNICANCHYEFHYLSDVRFRIKNEYRCEVFE